MTTLNNAGTAVITGASSGIGAVYAERLARRGYNLLLVARSADKLAALAATLARETGRSVATVQADLSKADDVRALEQRLQDDASITMLVNNAGVGATSSLVNSVQADIDNMLQLNVLSLTRLTRAVAPGMVARGHGAIINISSIAAVAPEVLNGAYGGSKAYVLALTQSLHHELKDKGIRVQAVLPGAIATPFWDRAGLPISNLPATMVMTPENLVDAALSGYDLGEVVTVPSLPDVADWDRLETARLALGPNLSRTTPAARYHVA